MLKIFKEEKIYRMRPLPGLSQKEAFEKAKEVAQEFRAVVGVVEYSEKFPFGRLLGAAEDLPILE